MCLLFETIRVAERHFCHLEYHQERVNRSLLAVFGVNDSISLASVAIPDTLPEGVVKCRLVYGQTIKEVLFAPYQPKPIRKVRLVQADHLYYPLKYLDRSSLEAELRKNPDVDELVFVRDGCVTDSTFSNLAFYDGSNWFTSSTPLLAGTCRKRLLDQGLIKETRITPSDLHSYTHISFINAMLDLNQTVLPTDQIRSSNF